MKRFLAAVLAASALSGASTARAADMLVKAPPPIVPFGWTGFYVGGNLGGAWDRDSFNPDPGSYRLPPFAFLDTAGLFAGNPGTLVFVPGTIPLPGTVTLDSGRRGSFLGGLQAGYNWQLGSLVYGLEGQIDGLKVSRAFAFAGPSITSIGLATFWSENLNGSGTLERDMEGSFRGRLGYAMDRLLIYGTGGVAVTNVRTHGAFAYHLALGPTLTPIPGLNNPAGSNSSDTSKTFVGGTVGAGGEYAVTNQLSLGVEYRHTFYGHEGINLGATPTLTSFAAITTPGAAVAGSYRLDSDEVMVRLNWLFKR